ncbi:MAG: membrane dipeptidase [Alicyclobacillus sp.]|nr:membrane dipeptidase [Alicyclobacillus sp.]
MQAGADALRAGNVMLQVFALFARPEWLAQDQLAWVLRMIDRYEQSVAGVSEGVQPVHTRDQLRAANQAGRIAGVLSLEGAGCLSGQPWLLRILYQLGVRGLGLTWNPANELADGCGEPRDAGLTEAGRAVLKEMERIGMWLDIAHLGNTSTREALEAFDGPVMASHANVRARHAHRRNLPDPVIRELIRRRGWIGLTFEASFVAPPPATIEHVFHHLDHILDLGGQECVGFGSDFDGLNTPVCGLESAAAYAGLAERLAERYGSDLADRILFRNLYAFLERSLPEGRAAPVS